MRIVVNKYIHLTIHLYTERDKNERMHALYICTYLPMYIVEDRKSGVIHRKGSKIICKFDRCGCEWQKKGFFMGHLMRIPGFVMRSRNSFYFKN